MTHARISRDPNVLMGKACIAGTRISVETVLRRISLGMSADEVAAEYPELQTEDVLAAVAYAAEVLRHDGLIAAE